MIAAVTKKLCRTTGDLLVKLGMEASTRFLNFFLWGGFALEVSAAQAIELFFKMTVDFMFGMVRIFLVSLGIWIIEQKQEQAIV